jgi:two-component system sensor histidine kinase UhpB
MRSLRRRLILLPAALLVAGLAAALGLTLALGRGRVKAEITSGMELASVLLEAERQSYGATPPGPAALDALTRRLSRLRHVDLAILPPPSSFAFGFFYRIEADHPTVPRWFAQLLTPLPEMREVTLGAGPGAIRLLIIGNPYDEIAELWGEWRSLTLLFLGLGALIVLLLAASAPLALRPLAELGAALEALGREEADVRLTPVGWREFAPIWDRFTALAQRLAELGEDNHRLIGKLISVQEEERKELAAELHDAVGPELFAIRAAAEALRRSAAEGTLTPAGVAEHAAAIARYTAAIQGVTARLLERLRPLVLAELGLLPALEQLCAEWQERCPELSITFQVAEEAEASLLSLGEAVALALYRGLQECLANVYRHAAGARAVEVRLFRSAEGLVLSIRDDGPGFAEGARFGHGLLGLAERLRAVGGRLVCGAETQAGAVIRLTVPCERSSSAPCPAVSS